LIPADGKTNPLSAFFKKAYHRFLKLRGSPRDIALGFALGLFVAMTPTLGFQMAIAVFFAAIFKWNKIAAVVGVWITNPVTAPIIYSINYMIGAGLLGINKRPAIFENPDLHLLRALFEKTPEILVALTLGGIVAGIPLALMGFYISRYAVQRYREKVKEKISAQREKLRCLKERRHAKRRMTVNTRVKNRTPKSSRFRRFLRRRSELRR
jgi:uncharacterized protein